MSPMASVTDLLVHFQQKWNKIVFSGRAKCYDCGEKTDYCGVSVSAESSISPMRTLAPLPLPGLTDNDGNVTSLLASSSMCPEMALLVASSDQIVFTVLPRTRERERERERESERGTRGEIERREREREA